MGRKRKPRAIVVIDFGGSITKIVVYIDGRLWSLNMELERKPIYKELINDYQSHKIGVALPCDRAGIGIGNEYYGVDFLAQYRFA